MNQSKKITDGALLIAIYIALLLIVVFVPFTVLIGLFILPIPFIVYTVRYGFKPSLIMFFVALVLSLIFATAVSLPTTLLSGIVGIVIGSAIHRGLTAYETWAQGTLGYIVGIVSIVLILQLLMDINLYEQFDVMLNDSINMTKTIIDQFGLSGPEVQTQMEMFEEQINTFKDLIPSSIAIISIIFAFITQWFSYKLMNRVERKQLAFPPFKRFNFPVSIIWIYFIALIIGLVDLDPTSGLYVVIVNVIALAMIFFAIQGFSFIYFYADHKKIPKAVPITILVLTFLLPNIFLFIIRIIGIIDLGFSLKKRIANGSNQVK